MHIDFEYAREGGGRGVEEVGGAPSTVPAVVLAWCSREEGHGKSERDVRVTLPEIRRGVFVRY